MSRSGFRSQLFFKKPLALAYEAHFTIQNNLCQYNHTYQLFFNLERPNTYKENKNPWQLAQEKRPDIPKEAFMLPPVDLDALLNKKLAYLTQGGYDVFSNPWYCIPH